ncbi:DinB family protein [Marinoscillum furvescens]|uniref:DinB family protein n=1 Tax=Marinoscillum furvescens DSM 4134 TaxID=1122208 RepID=A0A3D9KXD5_MARFU|nr:DinB family protein [Marinoscillum furvescens]RED93401.1 DinB family protein [Marinoscillum furvescens DSM 4134]
MNDDLSHGIELLKRTPDTLEGLLKGLSDNWTHPNEGPDTWSPFDILGHLIHGEETDWIPRLEIIMDQGESQPFDPFDRFAQFEKSKNKSINTLLSEFKELRLANVSILKSKNLSAEDLKKTGIHPELGRVTAGELLATWVTHDLNHIGQIARVMASQYQHKVGPWKQYLRILNT